MTSHRHLLSALIVLGFVLSAHSADDDIKLTKEEQAIVDLTNKERAKEKLPPLKVNPILMKAARGHSANMAKTGTYEHVIDGKDVDNRLDDIGYRYKECGENIHWEKRNTEQIVKDLMKSPKHRENILFEKYTEIGVGIVIDPKNPKQAFYTQVFGTPKKNKKIK